LSRFSRCTITGRSPKALPVRTLLRVIAIFVGLLGFGLAHLYLRFNTNELRAETIRLQSLQGTLLSEINAVRSQNETLKRPENLFDYARVELGMVPYRTIERDVLAMPENVYQRYEIARAAGRGPAGDRNQPEMFWVARLSEQFGLISQALAKEEH